MNSLDNFYAPARDVRSEQAFQRGVNSLSGVFAEKADEARKERRADEFQQGVADAMREEAGQELQGVKTGSIFRQHSKYYMAGLNETRGRAAAERFKAETALAYQEWDGRHIDDDGSAFREWMNGRVADFMGTLGDDQYRVSGALPVINEVATNYATQHTAFTNKRLEEESWNAYYEIIGGVFSDMSSGVYMTTDEDGRKVMDWDSLADALMAEADDMYITEGGAANDRLVDAAISYANTHNDLDALAALAKAHDSGKIKLSLPNQEKLANAFDAVEADIERETSKQNSKETAEAKARREATLNAWGEQLAQDPYVDLPAFSEVGDQQTYREMVSLQDAFIKGETVDNPSITNTERMKFEYDLFMAETSRDKLKVLTEFSRSNPTALSGADISRYSKEIFETANPNSIVNNPTVSKYRDGFGRLLGEFQLGDGYDINRSSFLRTTGERYFNDYLMSRSGAVDMTDPSVVRSLVKEAEDHAMEQLAFDFPEILREKNEQSPLGKTLGVDEALATRDEAAAAEAEEEFRSFLGDGGDQSREPGATGGSNSTPDPEGEGDQGGDLPIEEQPVPFDDPDTEVEYGPTREGFYGELLNRFTDGKDDRDFLKDAATVLQGDEEFKTSLEKLGAKYSVPPMAFMAVMDFETGGTFSSSVRNAAGSGATGLIQFMPSTARALGTTTEELAQMSRSEQMVYVEKYFDQFADKIRGGQVDDVYMAVLWPKAIGKPDGYVIFRQGTTAYTQNAGLDTNKDGTVTKFEAAAKVKAKFYGY